jgi:hypothetical protein
MLKAPAIYFPSTVVFLDDDRMYAHMLIELFGISGLRHFESSEFLLKQKKNDLLFIDNDIFKSQEIDDLTYLKQNLSRIKNSGNLISAIVSDLHMESPNGAELFFNLCSSFVGRVLISNFMSYQKNNDIMYGVNNGHIDIILDKTKDIQKALPDAVEAARIKFFTNLSNSLFSDVSHSHPLSDHGFAKFFISKIKELKPVEIRPNEDLNRFTFICEPERPTMVFTVTEMREIQTYLNSSAAESAPKELLTQMKTGKYILCHEESDDVLPDGSVWPLFIRPAKQFNGVNNKFYYSISEASNEYR